MSLLNVKCGEHSILIGADTLGYDYATRSSVELEKLFPIVHLNAVLAGRGSLGVLHGLKGLIVQKGLDFDGLADALPSLIPHAVEHMLAAAKARGIEITGELERDVKNSDIVLAGYSTGRRCLCAYDYQRGAGGAIERQEPERVISPWHESWGPAPNFANAESMARLAAEQVRRAHLHDPVTRAQLGGRLVMAQITPRRMTIEIVGAALSLGDN